MEIEATLELVLADPALTVVALGLLDWCEVLAASLEDDDRHDDESSTGEERFDTGHRLEPAPRRKLPTLDRDKPGFSPGVLPRFWAFIGINSGCEMEPLQLRAHYNP